MILVVAATLGNKTSLTKLNALVYEFSAFLKGLIGQQVLIFQ